MFSQRTIAGGEMGGYADLSDVFDTSKKVLI